MTKAIAKALYIELRKYTSTAQIILIPALKIDASGDSQPMRVLNRKISASHPRRSWRFYKSPTPSELFETIDLELATTQAVPFIQDIESYFHGFGNAGWEVYKTPVAVELTYDDIREVQDSRTPQAFMRRLTRARVGAGYQQELFSTSA